MKAAITSIVPKLVRNQHVRSVGIPIYRGLARGVMWHPPPKVVALSMPKAGTHLLSRVLGLLPSMMFSGLHLSEEAVFDLRSESVDFDHGAVSRMLDRCNDGQYMTAHFPHSDSLVSLFAKTGASPLVIVRDPRDVAVSYVHYVCSEPRHFHHHYFTTQFDTFEDRLTATLQGFEPGPRRQLGLRSLRSNIDRYLPWIGAGVTIVRFEDLVGQRGGGSSAAQVHAVGQIAAAVNRPLGQVEIQAIAERAFAPRARTFRAGKANAWPSALSSRHLELCAAELDDVIEAFGYPKTDEGKQVDADGQ